MVITFDFLLIEMAFVLATAFWGVIVGWNRMAIWVVGLAFSIGVADMLGPRLATLLNKLIAFFAQLLGIALNGNENAITPPTLAISDTQQPLAVAIFYLILAAFAYWIAWKLGTSNNIGLAGKVMGFLFGALGMVLILSKVSSYYREFVSRNGSDPLAGSATFSPSFPSFTIAFGGNSGAESWVGLGTIAIALFILLLVGYTIWRVVRNVIF